MLLMVASALVVVGVVSVALAVADDDNSSEKCVKKAGVTACVDLAPPFSPKASGLQPDSELRLTLVGKDVASSESPFVVHADGSGRFPGTNGGVTGIIAVEKVSRVTFSGTSANGNEITVAVPIG